MAKTSLVNLAKGNGKKPVPATKPVVKEVVEKKLTPTEERDLKAKERDLKAKQKVEELLEGVPMTPTEMEKKEAVLELDETVQAEVQGTDWLTETVSALTAENQLLHAEMETAKLSYEKIYNENQRLKSGVGIVDDGALKAKVVNLFNELQFNYSKSPGMSPVYPGIPNFVIHPVAFMERMIMFFPFLANEKRYRI